MKIFISYRREDSIHQSGRIHEWLCRHFGNQNIFFDVDSIPPGVNWKSHLNDMVSQCDVLLVPIGDQWLRTMQQRAAEETDMVRYEIQAALGRGIPIIPLQVGSAGMPDAKNLPEPIRELTSYQGLSIRPGPDFHNDMTRLIASLEKRFGQPSTANRHDADLQPSRTIDPPPVVAQPVAANRTGGTGTQEREPRTLRMAFMKAIPWTVGVCLIAGIIGALTSLPPATTLGLAMFAALNTLVLATCLVWETKAVVRFSDRNAFIHRVCEIAQKSHFTSTGIVYAFRLASEESDRLVFENMWGRVLVVLNDNSATILGPAWAVNVISKKVQRC